MKSLHDALKPVEWLRGRWCSSEGRGVYPTVSEFRYQETLEFTCLGQPMFNFTSLSAHPVSKAPMHQERGFLRVKPGTNQIAFILSHNFGLATIEEGAVDVEKREIKLKTTSVQRIPFAKSPKVEYYERTYRIVDGRLHMTLSMATESTPLHEHLNITYEKVSNE